MVSIQQRSGGALRRAVCAAAAIALTAGLAQAGTLAAQPAYAADGGLVAAAAQTVTVQSAIGTQEVTADQLASDIIKYDEDANFVMHFQRLTSDGQAKSDDNTYTDNARLCYVYLKDGSAASAENPAELNIPSKVKWTDGATELTVTEIGYNYLYAEVGADPNSGGGGDNVFGQWASNNDKSLAFNKVSIPNTVETIRDGAFNGCSNLAEVIFAPDSSVEEIQQRAFANTGIATINLPNSLKKLNYGSGNGMIVSGMLV